MRRVVIVDATELAEFQAVNVFHRPRAVELPHPHSHTHVFHLEQLHNT